MRISLRVMGFLMSLHNFLGEVDVPCVSRGFMLEKQVS